MIGPELSDLRNNYRHSSGSKFSSLPTTTINFLRSYDTNPSLEQIEGRLESDTHAAFFDYGTKAQRVLHSVRDVNDHAARVASYRSLLINDTHATYTIGHM